MGAVKNFYHDEMQAKAYIAEEMPEAAKRFELVAGVVGEHLCASERAKGEHWVIAAAVLHALDELDQ